MGIVRRMIEQRGTLTAPTLEDLRAFGALSGSLAGVPVNSESAMSIAAFYAGVRILSGLKAAMPYKVYRTTASGRENADYHPNYALLHDSPNPQMTAFLWREFGTVSELLWGNAYSWIEYDRSGRVRALWPLQPRDVDVEYVPETGDLLYHINADLRLGTRDAKPYQILHVPGLGFDGRVGKSRVRLFREGLGLTSATEKFGAAFFGNGARPGVVLQHPGRLKRDAMQAIKRLWNEDNQGVGNAQGTAVLGEGMTANVIGMPNEDAQFLQTRQFQIAEVSRMLGPIPLWMLVEHSKDTSWGSGVESQFIAFLQVTIVPELRRWEQQINARLFTEAERRAGFYGEFEVEGLLRADSATRAEFFRTMHDIGVYSVDDIRAKDNLPAIGGAAGNERVRSAAMVPIGTPAPSPVGPDAVPEPKPMDTPPQDQKSVPQANEVFRPLYEAAITRVMKRAQQHRPQIGNGKVTEESWLAEVREHAKSQLEPLDAAFKAAGGSPAVLWPTFDVPIEADHLAGAVTAAVTLSLGG